MLLISGDQISYFGDGLIGRRLNIVPFLPVYKMTLHVLSSAYDKAEGFNSHFLLRKIYPIFHI